MTNSTSSAWFFYGAPLAAGAVRALVGTPLDAVATREILLHQTTLQVMRNMKPPDYWRGFQPNLLKFTTRTPLQFFFVKASSSAVPISLDPAIRGIILGILTGSMETITLNGWNVLRTRFIQGQQWNVLKQEGFTVLMRGLSAAFAHRAMSWAIFMGTYEKLRHRYPEHSFAVSTVSGVIQVVSTAPFYIATIRKQDKAAPRLRLGQMLKEIYKTRGPRGLFLPALAPRLVHSAITSGPLLWLMEKLHLIHRKE